MLYSHQQFSDALRNDFSWKPVKLETSDLMMKLHSLKQNRKPIEEHIENATAIE